MTRTDDRPEVLDAPTLTDVGPDSRLLRDVFAGFPTGVAAICAELGPTAGGGEADRAVLVVSSFQVGISLDPALVLFAVQHSSTSWPRLRAAAIEGVRLGVSVLGQGHADAARQLAARSGNRFDGLTTTTTGMGAHFLHGASLWLECSLWSEVPAGDHDVVLLQVHGIGADRDVSPLVWHAGGFTSVVARPTP